MTKREWQWERRSSKEWTARVLPDGPDVVRMTGYGIEEWDEIKHRLFGPGDRLVVRFTNGEIWYDVVSSGTGSTATFRAEKP